MSEARLTDTLRETLSAFDPAGDPLSTSEVAARLDVGRRSTYDRLERLVERDLLDTKKVGASARVWWRPGAPASALPVDAADAESRARVDRDLTQRILQTVPVSLFVLDRAGQVVRANDRFREQLGREPVDGEFSIDDLGVYDEDGEPVPPSARPYHTVFETGEQLTDWQGQVDLPDGDRRWVSLNVAPVVEAGTVERAVVTARDLTWIKATERQLERRRDELERELAAVFERVDDAFFALDEAWRFTHVNEQAQSVLERSAGELLGRELWDALPAIRDSPFGEAYERAMTEQETVTVEAWYDPLDAWFEVRAHPSESGLSVYFRDVTERKRTEAALRESEERYRTLFESIDAGFCTAEVLFDESGDPVDYRFLETNPAFEELTGLVDAEGERMCELEPDHEDHWIETYGRIARTGAPERFTARAEQLGERWYEVSAFPFEEDGEHTVGILFDDVTERRERQRELERYETIVETVGDGIYALDGDGRVVLANEAFAAVVGYDPEEVVGTPADAFYDEAFSPVIAEREAAVRRGERDVASIEFELTRKDGDTVPVETRYSPFPDEAGRCGVVRDVSDRLERERELHQQREQLEALNNLNEVVREITDAVIDQSTREEVEETVCERLADTDSYRFAWFGDVDSSANTVELRAEAGVEGYLDGVTISVDPEDERSEGPTGRALRTGEVQTTTDIETDPRHDPWRDHVESYEIRSSAAVPIVYEDAVYGVLNVYADRPRAFEGSELTVLAQLGEVVGHAIAAAERKRALMSDEVVELEFRIWDLFDELGIDAEAPGTITIDQAVPVGDDEFLVYGTATEDSIGAVRALVEALPHWSELAVRGEESGGRPLPFEARLTEPPVLSSVVASGGAVDGVVVEDGDYHMTIHVPPRVDVRRITDAVADRYPAAELVRRRQVVRESRSVERLQRTLAADLTDRQRTTLEAAYHAGFFEWPRDASGEEVAESLGIASATFHQHLRKAQRKVLDEVLASVMAGTA